MRYHTFKKLVAAKGWTLAQLRCDVPPSAEILDLIDRIGLDKYERFVHLLEVQGHE